MVNLVTKVNHLVTGLGQVLGQLTQVSHKMVDCRHQVDHMTMVETFGNSANWELPHDRPRWVSVGTTSLSVSHHDLTVATRT